MNRVDALRYGTRAGDRGIEIGPWNNPIAPKAEGYRTIVADIYDTDYLQERGRKDSSIPNESLSRIEPVDVVLDGGLYESVTPYLRKHCIGELEFIISSHNLEHLPDPLSFFIDCEKLLKPLGVLNLAIPIASRCFDAMRELTTCGRIIDSYNQKKNAPSFGDIVDQRTSAVFTRDGEAITAVGPKNVNIKGLTMRTNLLNIPTRDYSEKLLNRFGGDYIDTHVSTFNPYSFELIFNDLCAFGYIKHMRILSTDYDDNSQEFIVNIEKSEKEREDFLDQERRLILRKKSLEHKVRDIYFLNSNKNNESANELFAMTQECQTTEASRKAFSMCRYLLETLKGFKAVIKKQSTRSTYDVS